MEIVKEQVQRGSVIVRGPYRRNDRKSLILRVVGTQNDGSPYVRDIGVTATEARMLQTLNPKNGNGMGYQRLNNGKLGGGVNNVTKEGCHTQTYVEDHWSEHSHFDDNSIKSSLQSRDEQRLSEHYARPKSSQPKQDEKYRIHLWETVIKSHGGSSSNPHLRLLLWSTFSQIQKWEKYNELEHLVYLASNLPDDLRGPLDNKIALEIQNKLRDFSQRESNQYQDIFDLFKMLSTEDRIVEHDEESEQRISKSEGDFNRIEELTTSLKNLLETTKSQQSNAGTEKVGQHSEIQNMSDVATNPGPPMLGVARTGIGNTPVVATGPSGILTVDDIREAFRIDDELLLKQINDTRRRHGKEPLPHIFVETGDKKNISKEEAVELLEEKGYQVKPPMTREEQEKIIKDKVKEAVEKEISSKESKGKKDLLDLIIVAAIGFILGVVALYLAQRLGLDKWIINLFKNFRS